MSREYPVVGFAGSIAPAFSKLTVIGDVPKTSVVPGVETPNPIILDFVKQANKPK